MNNILSKLPLFVLPYRILSWLMKLSGTCFLQQLVKKDLKKHQLSKMQIRRVFRNKKTNKQTHQFPKTRTYSLLHSFESSLLAYFFLPSCQLYAAAYPFQLISYDR